MNPDIRIEISFRGHRKRRKLQSLLGPGSTDHLIDLWIGSALSRPEGILHGYDPLDIAMEAGWDGDPQEFVNALVKVGFLDILDSGTYALHDWEEHQPFVVKTKEREEHARKASNARWSKRKSKTENAQCVLAASSENTECMPRVSSEDAQRMPGASSEHPRSNAPIPTPIPIVSNTDTTDISVSILSASQEAEQPETAPELSTPSAPDGARCTHLSTVPESLVPGEAVALPQTDYKAGTAPIVDDDEQPTEHLARASPAEAVTSRQKDGTDFPQNATSLQRLQGRHPIRRSSESHPHATTTHPDAAEQKELKEEATPDRLDHDHGHETLPEAPDDVAGPPGAKADPKVYLTKRGRKLSGWKLEAFDEFWESFAHKKGRAEAADAWLDIPELTPELARKIIEAAGREAKARPALVSKGQSPKWAQGWISARRWEDWNHDTATTHNQDNAIGQEVNHDARGSWSREEERAEYLESLTEALKRFM